MHSSPEAERAIREEFDALVNLEPSELEAWLKRPESHRVGTTRRGESESVGRQVAKAILAIRSKSVADLSEADYAQMKRVIGFHRRHLANRPHGDISGSRWRWSLMNWGHDPLRGRKSG